MSIQKKQKTGSQNLKNLGMLTTINQHFFPECKNIKQVYIHLKDEVSVDSCSQIIGDIIAINLPQSYVDPKTGEVEDFPPDVINLLITSVGGDLNAAYSLVSVIRGSKIPVRTIAIGEAYSAALCVLMSGHQRVAAPYASIMSHQFLSGTEGSYDNLKNTMAEFDNYYNKMFKFYHECTGLEESFIREKLLSNREHYFTPEKALEYNIVDLVAGLE